MSLPIVIIGTGLAAYNLGREFRKLDQETQLVFITQDGGEFYSKPLLSNAFSQGLAVENIHTSSAEHMAEQLNAIVHTYSCVDAIDREQKLITFNGQQLHYRDLVLALGAEPWTPPVAGDQPEIHSVNDLHSYAALRHALPTQQRVLILGAGLIGCEIANDLLRAGHKVSLVAPCAWPLPEQLPQLVGQALQKALEQLGASFYLNTTVQRFTQTEASCEALLSNGQSITVDTVITAAGLKPRIALAQAAGLAVNRGIIVDRYLQTSAQHIYALGDCIEIEGLNLQYILPLMAEVRALAKTLADQPTALVYGPMPTVVKTPALPLVFAGSAPPNAKWQIEGEAPDLKLQYWQGDQLHAYVLTGEKQRERLRLNRLLSFILPPIDTKC